MDSMLALLNEYRIIVGSILVVFVTAILLRIWWDKVSFWWLRVIYNLPIFGKIAKLSKQSSYDVQTGWFNSEKLLCADFSPYFSAMDKDAEFFDKCRSYLRKTQELGRNELPIWAWLLLAAMVFIEAMGFSYVLAGFTIPGASEGLQQKGAVGIAFLISCLLVFLTHQTGHEFHHNSLVRKVRGWYNTSGSKEKLVPNTLVSLDNELVDDGDDDKNPAWRQLLSRIPVNVNVTPTYKVTIPTVLFIILVAVGATYVRGQVLEELLLEEHQFTNSSGVSYEDPYNEVGTLPAELQEAQAVSDQQIDKGREDAQRKGGWGTFIVLAVIFIFLQIMGILVGLKTGFVGKESSEARKFIGSFRSREQFKSYYDRKKNVIAQIAQKNLEKLQGMMVSNSLKTNIDGGAKERLHDYSKRNFLTYIYHIESDAADHHVKSERRNFEMKNQVDNINRRKELDEKEKTGEDVLAEQVDNAQLMAKAKEFGMGAEEYKELLEEAKARVIAKTKPRLTREEIIAMMERELSKTGEEKA